MPNGENVMCRIADYVCRQSVTLVPGLAPDIRVEVWSRSSSRRCSSSAATLEGVTATIDTTQIPATSPCRPNLQASRPFGEEAGPRAARLTFGRIFGDYKQGRSSPRAAYAGSRRRPSRCFSGSGLRSRLLFSKTVALPSARTSEGNDPVDQGSPPASRRW